jgi:hypothetical protein
MSDQAEAPTPSSPSPPLEQPSAPRRRVRWTATKFFAAGTLVATFANVGVAIYQGREMRRQARIMERQTGAMEEANRLTKATQLAAKEDAADADRPWVGVSIIEVPAMLAGGRSQARVMLLNSGRSPALEVTVFYSFTAPTALPTTEVFPGKRDGPLVILPSAPVDRTLTMETALTPERVAEIRSEKRWFVVRVYVEYKDRIGREHHTGFCGFSNGGNFSACRVGNYAD